MSGIKPFDDALDHIFWCDTCNVPLITDTCGACSGPGRKVLLSPPGDVRFCSPFERTIISRLFLDSYGTDPLGDRLVLLNKIPGDDKVDEIIVDGRTIAVAAYDIVSQEYTLDLRIDGAKLLLPLATKKIVTIDVPREKHLNGKGISGQCVMSSTPDVKAGDIVLLKVSESFNGLGVARCDAGGLTNPSENTIKVRKIGSSRVFLNTRVSTIAEAVAANRNQLLSMEKDAIGVIRSTADQHKNLPVTVSFSGGKDSLVVFNITRKAVADIQAFFVDTGLEFPETVEFVEKFARANEVDITIQRAGNVFDQNFPAFGPPAKDFRWCCKVCKLGPITGLLSNTRGVITIDGKRRYESFQRGNIGSVERNPFVPGQISVFPIKDWRAIEVWLYIFMEKLPYNPLYDLGFERIGCWLCPAALQAEYVRMKDLHPGKYAEWQNRLYQWAQDSGLSQEYVDYGFWRWKALPPKMLNVARERGISLKPRVAKKLSLSMIRGISPCTAGGFSLEGVLSTGQRVAPEVLIETMKTIGTPSYSEDLDVMLIRTGKGTSKLFAGGQIYASSDDKAYAQRLFAETVRQVLRAALCSRCRICVKACPKRAIRFDSGHLRVDESKCNKCGKCTRACVISRYYDKLTAK